ncbi:MAG: hypothetical protein REJ23_13700 [Brevundimonas sp.]|nr:hypothetical protein [Brevundimonas sp.]
MPLAATDAAFEGFRLVRREPKVLIAWALVYLVFAVIQLGAIYLNRDNVAAGLAVVEGFGNRMPSTPEEFNRMMEGYNQATSHGLWLLPFSLVIGAVISAAVSRAVLFPEQKAYGYLRLGMDEVRVLVITVIVALLSGVGFGAAMMAVAILGAIAIMVPILWIAVGLGVLAAIALFIWLLVKWSLAIPIVMTEKRLAVFESFRATKGQFWPLLGLAIIAGVLGIVVWALSLVVVMPLSMLSGLGPMGAGNVSEVLLERLTSGSPMLLLSACANAIVSALVVGVFYAPFSAIWRDLKTSHARG